MDKQVTEAVDAVEALCKPGLMSKTEALEFLEAVVDRLGMSADALREEIEGDQS